MAATTATAAAAADSASESPLGAGWGESKCGEGSDAERPSNWTGEGQSSLASFETRGPKLDPKLTLCFDWLTASLLVHQLRSTGLKDQWVVYSGSQAAHISGVLLQSRWVL